MVEEAQWLQYTCLRHTAPFPCLIPLPVSLSTSPNCHQVIEEAQAPLSASLSLPILPPLISHQVVEEAQAPLSACHRHTAPFPCLLSPHPCLPTLPPPGPPTGTRWLRRRRPPCPPFTATSARAPGPSPPGITAGPSATAHRRASRQRSHWPTCPRTRCVHMGLRRVLRAACCFYVYVGGGRLLNRGLRGGRVWEQRSTWATSAYRPCSTSVRTALLQSLPSPPSPSTPFCSHNQVHLCSNTCSPLFPTPPSGWRLHPRPAPVRVRQRHPVVPEL